MTIYIYRQEPSTGARELAVELGGVRWRGLRTPIERKATRGDFVISWGESIPNVPVGVKVLNGVPIRNKYQDALTLKEKGISTIEVSLNKPIAQPARIETLADPAEPIHNRIVETLSDFIETDYARNQVYRDGLTQVIRDLTSLQTTLNSPVPTRQIPGVANGTWLARLKNHTGGTDLLTPPAVPEFYVKKEEFTNEYRIHSFLGKSIRAGKKAPREGFNNPHNWIRSWDGGWRILYDGVSSKKKYRKIAHDAVKALGLDFGAVDIGERADGTLVVLEVNRAPGIEGGTVDCYKNAIQKWVAGEWTGA